LGIHGQPEASQAAGGKPRYEVRAHPKFAEYHERLKNSKVFEERQIAGNIDKAKDVLKDNLTAGEIIPRDRWPKLYRGYARDLGLNNLRHYVIDGGRRLIYSIMKVGDGPVFAWILNEMSHKEYEQRFGYG
jgi:hypothetical protein